ADLAKVDGKAELIAGRIVHFMATGRVPGRVAKRILRSLDDYEARTGVGEAVGDNVGYALPTPLRSGRESFSPDASYYIGPSPADSMGFIEGPPTFAVEVRSENDYTPSKDREYEEKRSD
ncbi:MAG TPA: Uma2 family endonuclease, partial [Urbifossiella sp.]|nr:Uma2 family endonuclease [Urbifossiella sp.]